MADPISFVALGKALGALLGLLSKIRKASAQRGVGQEEVDALEALVKSFGDLTGAVPAKEAPEQALGARYQALVLGAFLRAWNQLHASESTVRPSPWSIDRASRELHEELTRRVESAVTPDPGVNLLRAEVSQVGQLAELLQTPLASRWYRALWQGFAGTRMRIDAERPAAPLLDVADRWTFERYFLLAWWLLVESAAGAPLRQDQAAAGALRVHLVRQFLLTDMAGWGQRHVFGNETRAARGDDLALPFMALEEMYVEPDGVLVDRERTASQERRPITTLIESLLAEGRKIIVVVANFGHGKSVTARTLASRWAGAYLAQGAPSAANRLPVFVRCADCLDGHPDLPRSVRRSNKGRAARLDVALDLDSDDAIYAPPEASQDAVYLYDGLDEVVWGRDSLKQFFQVLAEKASARQRFVVFSRPDVIPSGEEMRDVAVVQLQPLSQPTEGQPSQIADWLERWNRIQPDWLAARRAKGMEAAGGAPLTVEALREAGLESLASTPILLFLMAYGYALNGALGESHAALYEDFFWHIARGKFERDAEQHPRVKQASEDLAERLKRRGLLDEAAAPPMAMLWLMSRVAWESSCKEWLHRLRTIREGSEDAGSNARTALVRRNVELILEKELDIQDEHVIQGIQVGMLLALQADLHGGQHHILYGHQSFREFLAARYWADRLRAALRETGSRRDEVFKHLYGGRLLGEEDRSIDFLEQILRSDRSAREGSPLGWNDAARRELAKVTWEEFQREEPLFDDTSSASKRLIDNRRPPFREAMLIISNLLKPVSITTAEERLGLQSMRSYFWGHACPDSAEMPCWQPFGHAAWGRYFISASSTPTTVVTRRGWLGLG